MSARRCSLSRPRMFLILIFPSFQDMVRPYADHPPYRVPNPDATSSPIASRFCFSASPRAEPPFSRKKAQKAANAMQHMKMTWINHPARSDFHPARSFVAFFRPRSASRARPVATAAPINPEITELMGNRVAQTQLDASSAFRLTPSHLAAALRGAIADRPFCREER